MAATTNQQPLVSPTRERLLPEKSPETPASILSTSSSAPQHAKKPKMEGALVSLLWGAFAPCIPVAIVSGLLLTVILYYRIDNSHVFTQQILGTAASGQLVTLQGVQQFENNGGDNAYFLYHHSITNPAVLHTIASWTAKIIPFLTGASMALVAFFAGQRIIRTTKDNTEKLPPPHQVSILIGLLDGGGVQPLIDTIRYRWQGHENLVQPVPLAFWCLSFIIFITFAIGGVDSWFGTATTAMNIALVVPTSNISQSFGRALNQSCVSETWYPLECPSNYQATCMYPCSITDWIVRNEQRRGLDNAQSAAETLMSTSTTTTILNATFDGSNHFFLGDSMGSLDLDFIATTLAITAQCQVVTPNCYIGPDAGFSCNGYNVPSFSSSGEVGVDGDNFTSEEANVGIQFFNDSALSQPVGVGSTATELFSIQNPLRFLTWSKGFPPMDLNNDAFAQLRDDRYFQYENATGDTVFILNCSATIHQAQYYWNNGTVFLNESNALKLAPDYYGAALSAPFATNSVLSRLALQDAAALAAYKNVSTDVANVFSDHFSRAAVALMSGISIPTPNEQEWSRDNNYLATRVPYIPLYLLLALKAVYAVFALGLALLAAFLTKPSEAQEVKQRLTVDGLAAGFFEPEANHERAVRQVQDLFKEHESSVKNDGTTRIGLKQTPQGGWLWVDAAKRVINGLGIPDVIATVADQAAEAASGRAGTVGRLGQDYRAAENIL